jgi:hypothetical protein
MLVDPDGKQLGDFYNESGNYLGNDGINDRRVYQTTDKAWNQYVRSSTDKSTNTEVAAGLGSTKYDNVKESTDTDYLGETNEFGLIQLTKMGNDNILNNSQSEDSYSYTKKDGTKSSKGKHGDDWADPGFAAAINYAVKTTGVTIVVNDVSAYNPTTNLGHASHRGGVDADIRYITTDGAGSINTSNLTPASIQLNVKFVKALKSAGFKEFLTDGSIPGTKKLPNHSDHMHFGF